MKNHKLRFTVLGFILYFIIGFPFEILSQTNPGDELQLEGLELAKGVNLTDTFRIGTIFAGDVFYNQNRIGRWTAMLSHKGTENIELCKGRGDIVTMRLTIHFNSGKKIVLGMVDFREEPDVFWHYTYAGLPCSLGGLDCQTCDTAKVIDCEDEGSSDLAKVEPIILKKKWGSTINVRGAILKDGRLCHYYPLVPRVSALLRIY
jgi:hypothetical protein